MTLRCLGICVSLLACLWGCQTPPGLPGGERVVLERDSMYHHLVISEDAGTRYLRFGYGRVQSAMDLDDPVRLAVPYTAYLTVGMAFTHPRRVLMIGLAGGSLVRFLRAVRPDMEIDVVEIDPEVVRVAGAFFEVEEEQHCRIFVQDGRMFVKRTHQRYDWVILDAFHADTVPYHLTTVEFLDEVKSVLNPGGVVTANVVHFGPGILYRSLIRTFAAAFPQVYLFPVPNRGNIVLAATLDPDRISGGAVSNEIRALKQEAGPALALLEPEGPLMEEKPVVVDAPLLTDDYAPVDLLRYRER